MQQLLKKWTGKIQIPRRITDFRDKKVQKAYAEALTTSVATYIDGSCRNWIRECLRSAMRPVDGYTKKDNGDWFEPIITDTWHGEIGLIPCVLPARTNKERLIYKITPGSNSQTIKQDEILTALNTRVMWNSDTGLHDYQWVECVQKNYWITRHGTSHKGSSAFENAIIVTGYVGENWVPYSKPAFRYHFQDVEVAVRKFIELCKTT